ncbi:MAG: hypothetical protein MN733_41620 [Nitrososphaera sp.]|nr:hypothetical protein [Nitrososphaera sp.]
MINMTKEHFLSLLEETKSHIEWYLDGNCIRGRLPRDDTTPNFTVCPITGVAWYLGYPLKALWGARGSIVDLGLNEDLADRIIEAADDDESDGSDGSDEIGSYSIRQPLLKAAGLE